MSETTRDRMRADLEVWRKRSREQAAEIERLRGLIERLTQQRDEARAVLVAAQRWLGQHECRQRGCPACDALASAVECHNDQSAHITDLGVDRYGNLDRSQRCSGFPQDLAGDRQRSIQSIKSVLEAF